MQTTSTPSLFTFDPTLIPYQYRVIKDIRTNFDYSLGTHEILLSGSVGSSKSTLLAHIAVTHCLLNRGARFMIGRLSMPALRSTLFQKILEHLGEDLEEGVDYIVNLTTASVRFRNGSEIISRSWADKKYFKVRSLELSGAAIEESSENEDDEFYSEIQMRVGRLPHVKENIIIHATNPSSPSHWLYKHFSMNNDYERKATRHIYYSITTDNPFLPPQYIEQLKADMDPKLARRMIYGEWIEISGEVIYSEYQSDRQYLRDKVYKIDPHYPVVLTWDFNIAENKPMSALAMQYIQDTFHVFAEVIIDGGRTADTVDEFNGRGLLRPDFKYIICGDAAGKHRDTRSLRSDYDIILKALRDLNLNVEYQVPPANPAIRLRHNRVNAYCLNALNETRLYLYQGCATLDEGLRLTKLKQGANYIEDDSKRYQHCTTALGYAVSMLTIQASRIKQGSIIL